MDKISEVLIDRAEQTLGTEVKTVGSIASTVCHGRFHFLKRSTGDEVYISVGGKEPSSQSYHVVLTDQLPSFTDNVVAGDVKAVGSAATSRLSTFATGGFWIKEPQR